MFNAERNETYGVSVDDPIEWTLTTKGYLSDGCSHPITINGGFGDDSFDVLRNKCVLDLNGNSDNDNFVVRSFAALPLTEDGNIINETDIENDIAIHVCNETLSANETVSGYTCGDNKVAVEPPANPDYLVNSLVDIDGGTGNDRLTVVGTEFNDRYVVQEGKIFGGGLTIKFTNINFLDVTGQEGDDTIYVLSTNPSLLVSLYGSLGSDTFVITPPAIDPVTSQNLRGHRGIIEHEVTSDDPSYAGLTVRGVQCDVLDNDGNYSYVSVVDDTQGGFHLMDEDGVGAFSFFIYPTTPPKGDVIVNVVAPAAIDENRYVLVNSLNSTVLQFTEGDMMPQEVEVTYNPEVIDLSITDMNLLIKIDVDETNGTTTDERFLRTEQSVLPIDIKLIPGMNNSAGAKSITIEEDRSGTAVTEGPEGFNATYDLILRPCSDELLQAVVVELEESVPDQLNLSTTVLDGTDFNSTTCRATVKVAAFDDNNAEGDHYVNIRHVVKNGTDGGPIFLTDGSQLYAPNVLVQIYDDDIGGVIIRETNGITALAEMDEADNSNVVQSSYYEDEYSIRLTKRPAYNTTVRIKVSSIAVSTEVQDSIFTPDYRNLTERTQVYVNGSEIATLIFTAQNWSDEVLLHVTAIDDKIEEGVNLLNFASQPSNLVRRIMSLLLHEIVRT